MPSRLNNKGFSAVEVVVVIVIVAVLGVGGFFVWQKNKDDEPTTKPNTNTSQGDKKNQDDEPGPVPQDETTQWASVTTQDKAFTMKVPDGWKLTSYPGDFLGSESVNHQAGTQATIETSDTEYVRHSLKFRASVTELDDAGLGPQWESPQPNLEESTEDFSIGDLRGKRYKGTFSGSINQTLYEYVFDLGNNKKLDILYTVYHNQGDKDDVATVEKAIKTIQLNNQ